MFCSKRENIKMKKIILTIEYDTNSKEFTTHTPLKKPFKIEWGESLNDYLSEINANDTGSECEPVF